MNKLKSAYGRIFHYDVVRKLRREIDPNDSVLDLGCGWNSLLQHCDHGYSLGVETYDYYIELSKQRNIHAEYIQEDIRNLDLETGSFDIVLLAQVLEHLPKDEGYRLLKKTEKWARKKVIVTTPNGFLEKAAIDNNEDQEHLSGWTVDELKELGYRVLGSSGFKLIRERCMPKVYWRAMFNMTSVLTPYLPKLAFQLFAVKESSE